MRHHIARRCARRHASAALLYLAAVTLVVALDPAYRAGAAAAAPVLNLVPKSGPCNEANRVVARGAGFRPGQELRLRSVRSAPVRGGAAIEVGWATVAADGTFALPLPRIGCDPADPPGTQYTISVADVVASPSAVFTVGTSGERCFAETGFCVKERFFDYWQAHGLDLGDRGISERESLALFGYPISKEFVQALEDGTRYTVQYFERARFEWHQENASPYDVLLGQFGRRILATVPNAPTAPVAPSTRQGYTHFRETGHNVAPDFALFWSRNGGLAVFGYPLSEEFEQTLEDGKSYTVQYFERARFERHPAREGMPYNVQLGQFGRLILGPTGGPTLP